DRVNVEFSEGQMHAVLGENGAGKSTLIKIISGVWQPDEGNMYLDGKDFKVANFIDALKKGVSIVNQELQILPGMSIAENIMLDKMLIFKKTRIIDWKKINQVAKKYLDLVDLSISPATIIGSLSVGQKQMVEIAKALASNSRILLLDEPTSSISAGEVRKLFGILSDLKKKGIILILVTHKLEEVFQICEKVTVLRDGKHIGTNNIDEVDKKALVKMMIGREEKFKSFQNSKVEKDKKVLEVKNINKKDKALNISFDLYKKEILGFYGLVGAGRTELARLIIGLDKKESGDIFINGKKMESKSISNSLNKYKIAYITENRKEEGLLLNSSVLTNITITIWSKIASKILRFINIKKEIDNTIEVIKEMDIKTTGADQIVNTLSGGNQQKVSIGKWLIAESEILIFDEPTVGIDVGAKEYIHELIFNLASKEGKSIILISSDMPEIIKLSNRILVFQDKGIIGEVDNLNKYNNDYDIVSQKIADCYHEID
ncbi:MAG: sugar ABC transporter ATP-binding protein, partial [Actinobacteria bacterium]|nr:sugar ABC transporter ATP-binding protein [Actinomycetota bacterium]